jgi:hypothetical protein
VELTTWYLVAPPKLLQAQCHSPSHGSDSSPNAARPMKMGFFTIYEFPAIQALAWRTRKTYAVAKKVL